MVPAKYNKMPMDNKIRSIAFSAASVLILGLLLVFFWPAKREADARKTIDIEVEGVNLTYLSFNKNNEKKLEIKCRESQKKDDDKLWMKKITATVFKADKLDEDIAVFADSGYAQNDFNDFYLQGNVSISSSTFTLKSKSFDLKGLNLLSTKDPATFKLRDVTGLAQNGMAYFINNKYLKMLKASGVFVRAGKPYDFQAQTLRVVEKKKMLFLDRNAEVDDGETRIRGDRITLQFDKDFAILEWAAAYGTCHLQTTEIKEKGKKHSKEINANQIKMLNDLQGRLQKIVVLGDGVIHLVDGNGSGRIESGTIEIALNSETQILQTVRALSRGTLTHRGRDNVKVTADSLQALYGKDGVLTQIQAEGKCEFATDDFSGTASRLDYDALNSRIEILGKDAVVFSKKNTFNSSRFVVRTQTRQLASDQGVKATLALEKKSVLLRAQPVFVTAAGMEMSEKGNLTRFKGKVRMFQNEIELQTGEMLFETRSNRISCLGSADLKFITDNEQVVVHGKSLFFHADQMKIALDGDARLQQGGNALAAGKIELDFDRDDRLENITATDHALFSKQDLSGKAQLLSWHFSKKNIWFRNSAEISKKEAGTTKGQELRLDLSSNEISVSSGGDRSETIIRQEAP